MTLIRSKLTAAALALTLTTLLAACGSSSSSSSSASAAPAGATATSSPTAPAHHGPVSVAISGYAFHPATITVATGTKVKFTNHDQTAHTATSNRPGFDTGTVQPGQTATVTLKKPGTYTYYCQFHAFMHAAIVVR
jgi:plastocyanin